MIIRGTTPYQEFILPLLAEEIADIYVTYMQNDEVILDKSKADITLTNMADLIDLSDNASMDGITEDDLNSCQLGVHLTQEDTLKFHFYPAAKKNIAVIQIRLVTTSGEAFASMPVNERIFGVLHDGVIPEEENNENLNNEQG